MPLFTAYATLMLHCMLEAEKNLDAQYATNPLMQAYQPFFAEVTNHLGLIKIILIKMTKVKSPQGLVVE